MSFLEASTAERLRMALMPECAPIIEQYLGTGAFAEYASLARSTVGADHLAAGRATNLIFVPGIMGTSLKSAGLGGIWWVQAQSREHIDDLRLSRDGASDAHEAYRIAPVEVDGSYEGFLAAVHLRDDFNHRTFPYDWRKSLTRSARDFSALVSAIHRENGGEPVHLVGHSMGGLMIRAALMLHGDELWPCVGQIAFIGTPHYGSPAIRELLEEPLLGV